MRIDSKEKLNKTLNDIEHRIVGLLLAHSDGNEYDKQTLEYIQEARRYTK